MRNIWTIFRKEIARIFKDPRMILMLILPGLLVAALYSFMGDMMTPSEDAKNYRVYIEHAPTDFMDLIEGNKIFTYFEVVGSNDDVKEKLKNNEAEVLLIFPENFAQQIAEKKANPTLSWPNIVYYNNSSSVNSITTAGRIKEVLEVYRNKLISEEFGDTSLFTINHDKTGGSVVEDVQEGDFLVAMMMPFLLIVFLFSAAMSISVESIAGEKDRGTIATLLVTPVKRSEIALGKIISLSVLSIISAISSFVGILISLPKLMGEGASGALQFHAGEYLLILVIIISIVMVFVGVISVVSAFAKTVKEATFYVMPLMIVFMLVGISSMMGTAPQDTIYYVIPVYNAVQILGQMFLSNINITQVLITILSNIVVAGIFVYVLTVMFKSERIMFNK